jgi:deazaflavin-dependent oxidoreductase (nitroreductase family)
MRTAVWLYRRSGGKIGGKMGQAPVALLTTTGRKSGRSWTNPVLYQPEGDGWVIIASYAGKPRHPAWWLNLKANPEATIEMGRDSYPVTASEVPDEDRERLWRKMTAVYPTYDEYQKKTTRRIPVVYLTRR